MKTVFIFTSLAFAVGARADEGAPPLELQRLAALVDYVAADYPGAVGDGGQVQAATEYEEQRGLVRDAANLADRIAPRLHDDLAALVQAVDARATPSDVALRCRTLRARLVDELGLVMSPAARPDLQRAQS